MSPFDGSAFLCGADGPAVERIQNPDGGPQLNKPGPSRETVRASGFLAPAPDVFQRPTIQINITP